VKCLFGLLGPVVLIVFAGSACTSASTESDHLTVFAASSLSGALPALSAAWNRSHPNVSLLTSTGATSALRTQIEQGAPADVLLGADTSNPQALIDEGDALGPITEFATNAVTIIVKADNPAGIRTPVDLARPGVCVIAAGGDVPITRYAEQLVTMLADRPEYGPAFASGYEANICSREDNVGAVVNKVSLGEGDAAIVYVSDAKAAAEKVAHVELPIDVNVVANYGGVAIKESPHAAAAAEFLAWLRGRAAQAVLSVHGLGAAP
jgi:molybdate transport system substrate-binding protein